MRFGLCCQFLKAPIKFRDTTVTYLKRIPNKNEYLSQILWDNSLALELAIRCCEILEIGSFRVNSQFFPAYSHPEVGYRLEEIPESKKIFTQLEKCRTLSQKVGIRLTFHPDQFVVLNSPNPDIFKKSCAELEYHALMADLIGADVITLHVGGVYGDKKRAMKRFEEGFSYLSSSVRSKLAIENDDKCYTPQEVLSLCNRLNIPFVYDVHHHRCHGDQLSVQQATYQALKTWNREPLFHLSSPANGWHGPYPSKHHDLIDVKDFPKEWLKIESLTIEIEAKAKEIAVLKLMNDLGVLASKKLERRYYTKRRK